MDDKFVLVGLDDEKSKHIAEVLKNSTCKKILDFLADYGEASEQDISKNLEIPLNTAEYNLKKLIKAGLVEKAKNFFWSVKGKKIPTYKLAKKHIIISHKSSKPSLNVLRTLLPVLAVIAVAVILVAVMYPRGGDVGPGMDVGDDLKLRQFESYSDLKSFIDERVESQGFLGGIFGGVMEMTKDTTMAVGAGGTASSIMVDSASEYSETNIQVEGVDEADIVKNDGKHIYIVSSKKVVIVDAYPAESMEILSEIEFNEFIGDIFINDDKLIVFGSTGSGGYYSGGSHKGFIYDISDRENPVLDNEIEIDGSYVDSRMIGDYVYIVSSKFVRPNNPEPPVFAVGGVEKEVMAEEVYYFPHDDNSYVFTSIIALNIESGDFDSETYLTGSSRQIYVSQNNIYLVRTEYTKYETYFEETVNEVYLEVLPFEEAEKVREIMDSDKSYYIKSDKIQEIVRDYSDSLEGDNKAEFDSELFEKLEELEISFQKKYEKTAIYKIGVDGFDIDYKGAGKVPGRILNQFSMDEYDGNFRIATTTGQVSRSERMTSLNHLYILDEDLEIMGKVEDLAPGERIYSARFMGKRAYIVTFKKVDPLFVIDVSDPEEPEVLGYLKITGYSDYLHPYDENHIIGIGKETRGGGEQFSWYQGVKISLFDVSDVENPIEKAKIEIGDRGTDSYALHDHHAFLFDREKNLLVVPITLAEVDETQYSGKVPDNAWGREAWQGAYVLNINTDEISVRGRITHDEQLIDYREYGPAVNELVGATREDWDGNIWTKEDDGMWTSSAHVGTRWGSIMIDQLPGGVNYGISRDWNNDIKRSLYMDDYLYTISNKKIKANNLETIEEISSVDLGWEDSDRPVVLY
ncbi:hypothetical protein CL621_00335 [archaeon]|nr:hypothetical protein [archaeon]